MKEPQWGNTCTFHDYNNNAIMVYQDKICRKNGTATNNTYDLVNKPTNRLIDGTTLHDFDFTLTMRGIWH
jgi:hypothetical protein